VSQHKHLWKLRKTVFPSFFFVHLVESLLQQDKEDGSGGSEVMIETSADLRMQGEIQEFYAWLDEGRNTMTEAGTRERNNDSAGVT
jgi:hypothetical protein